MRPGDWLKWAAGEGERTTGKLVVGTDATLDKLGPGTAGLGISFSGSFCLVVGNCQSATRSRVTPPEGGLRPVPKVWSGWGEVKDVIMPRDQPGRPRHLTLLTTVQTRTGTGRVGSGTASTGSFCSVTSDHGVAARGGAVLPAGEPRLVLKAQLGRGSGSGRAVGAGECMGTHTGSRGSPTSGGSGPGAIAMGSFGSVTPCHHVYQCYNITNYNYSRCTHRERVTQSGEGDHGSEAMVR